MKHTARIFPVILIAVLTVWVIPARALDEETMKALADHQISAQEEYHILLDAMSNGESLTDVQKIRFLNLEEQFGPDCRNWNPLDNQGGPDGFGYRFIDNQAPDTATYDWIELRGDPETIWINAWSSHDDGYSTSRHPIGFSFPFYTASYDSFRVATNGFIQFMTTGTSLSNVCLPSTAVAGPAIFPLWNDLHLDRGGISTGIDVVGYKNFGDYTVIEFDSIGNYSSSCVGTLKFEAVLYSDGAIKLQYNQLVLGAGATCDSTMTIGIQEAGVAGSNALNYVCNLVGIQPVEQLAIWFYPTATGSLSGTVVDDNNAPVPNATVRILQNGATASTDNNGDYSFPIIGEGTYDMVAAKYGYEPDTLNGVVVTEGQNTVADFTLVSQGLITFSSTDIPQAIPSPGSVSSILTINQAMSIADLNVYVDITHPYVGDIRILLTSPDGVSCVLTNRHGTSGDNFAGTIFDDEADSTIVAGHPPYSGPYRPDSSLSIFDDNSTLGTWTLTVEDLVAANIGTLNAWELYLQPGTMTGGSITGTVTSAESNDPIAGALVEIQQTGATRTTFADGTYSFGLVPAGTYTMNFSAAHYDPLSVPNVVVAEGQNTTQDAALPGNAPSYVQDFESSDGWWVAEPATGGWEWGVPTSGPGAAHSGVNLWGTVLGGNYAISCCYMLTLSLGLVVESPTATVEFWRWYDTEASFDGCNFKVSTDGGTTWEIVTPVNGYTGNTNTSNNCIPSQPAWTGHTGGSWVYDVMPIGQYMGQVPQFRFTFSSDASIVYPGFYFDDMTIWGLGTPAEPVGVTADGNFDDRIRLNWLPLGLSPAGTQISYDNGQSSPNVDGLGWWGSRPEAGWLVSRFDLERSVDITGIRAFFTQNATAGSPIQLGVFADAGNGTPSSMPLAVIDATQQPPFNEYQDFDLSESAHVADGSFFVGVRQMSANTVALGGDESQPFVRNTFFHSSSNGEWTPFEPAMMVTPMLGARLADGAVETNVKAASRAVTTKLERGPLAARAAVNPVKGKAMVDRSVEAKDVSPVEPSYKRTLTTVDLWRTAGQEFFAVDSREPYVSQAMPERVRPGSTLDDVLYYKIYRDNVFLVNDTLPPYDDVVGSGNENVTHSYFLTAWFDDNTESGHSDTVSAAANMAPGAPTNVAGDPQGQTQMRISWVDPTVNVDGTNCVDLTTLAIYREGVLLGTVNPGVQQYVDTPPQNDQFYTWTVRARDEVPNEGPGASFVGAVVSPWQTIPEEWVDITGNGTDAGITGDDQNVGPFDLGFTFPFYGNDFTSIRVCSNGFLSFTSTSTTYTNGQIPSTVEPNNGLYPFWDDLYPPSGGYQILYRADSNPQRFIVSYINVPHIGAATERYTFQVILSPDGGIVFNYDSISTGGTYGNSTCTVGVENASGTEALQLCYNNSGDFIPTTGTAVEFWGGPSGSLEGNVHSISPNIPLEGVLVQPQEVPDFTMTDANGLYSLPLEPGTYTVTYSRQGYCDSTIANILIEDNSTTVQNVGLRAPHAQFSATSLNLQTVVGQDVSTTFNITNTGGQCPLEFSITDTSAWLSTNPESGSVPQNQSLTITVNMSVQGLPAGDYQSALVITHEAVNSPATIPVSLIISPNAVDDPGLVPTEFALNGNYPNPFNSLTEIRYDLPQAAFVTLRLYNLLGQEVRTLMQGSIAAGRHTAVWDGRDNSGVDLTSGLYIVRLDAAGHTFSGKVMLLK